MIFRQLFDPQSSTYTCLLADAASRDAVLIDPVFEQVRREAAMVGELGARLVPLGDLKKRTCRGSTGTGRS